MSILMEDLLKEITSLSSRLHESQSDSNSTSEVGPQSQMGIPGIDSLQMRNKARSRRRRGKKRRIDCHPELYTESESSCSDSSEDEAIRDYIENVTSASRPTISDSDEEFVPRRRGINILNGVPWSPLEVGESDSFSENIMSVSSRKKRKIKKMNKKLKALESLEQIAIPDGENNVREKIGQLRRELEQNQNKKLKKRKQKSLKNVAIDMTNMEIDVVIPQQRMVNDDDDDDNDDDAMKVNEASSDDVSCSESEGESSGSNEADDEGEESCVEASLPAAFPFWENEDMLEDEEEKHFKLVLSQSFGLLSDECKEERQREVNRRCQPMAPPKLNENANYLTYANKRIRAFIEHENENELCLNAFCDTEQDQMLELAALYSLSSQILESPSKKRILLLKTRNTREPDGRTLKKFLKKENRKISRHINAAPQRWGSKRRKTSPAEVHIATENATPIPESNVGNQMLRNMGWTPGTGLGRESTGILKPVAAHKRPKKLGLGFPC